MSNRVIFPVSDIIIRRRLACATVGLSVHLLCVCAGAVMKTSFFFISVQKYPQQTFKQQKWKVKQKTERVNHLHCNPTDQAQRKWLFPSQLWTPRYLAFIQNGGTINKPLILHRAKGT